MREWNKAFGLMSNEQETRFVALIDGMADLLRPEKAFKLLTLLAMFTHGISSGPTQKVAQRYLNALKRCFLKPGFQDSAEEANFEMRVRTALTDIKELSAILQNVSESSMVEIASIHN